MQATIFDGNYQVPLAATPSVKASASAVFKEVFNTHFKRLHIYAITFVKDEDVAEDMVQNVFYKLWEKNREMIMKDAITPYLYRAVHNESLNFLKHQKIKAAYQNHAMKREAVETSERENKKYKSLEAKLEKSLKELPEQCSAVFQMSRFEGLKYREIAEQMNISVKTVEKHMGKALKILRLKLADHLSIVILLFMNYFF